ncbi:MAG TPA: outer membrane protein assembly factor BamA [Caulobacterales bacterium]|nr:outer membrane protein assembly factor BamA [Caulobacterales bacterium]
MKRGFREVLLGAVSCVATVSAGGGAWLVDANVALAQGVAQPPPTADVGQPAPATPAPAPTRANGRAAAAQAAPRAATPPAAPTPAQLPVIRQVQVQGNQRVETSTVISYLSIQPGDIADPARIDLSLKTLFATGLFADVQIVQQDANLVVSVVENPIINRVVFEGLKALKQDKVEKDLQAKPRAVFTAARVQADVQRIVEVYRRSGRFAATVTPQVKQMDQNRVDLIFKIDEGPVTHIRAVNFIGNGAFSDGSLRRAIRTEQSRWWKLFTNADNYDPDQLEYDRELLRQYYTNRGYADFRVVSAVAELTPDQKDFYVTFTVDEGERYKFGKIDVSTELDKLPKDLLRLAVPIKSGEDYQGDQIEKTIDALTYIAGTAGYANVDIRPVTTRDKATRRVNINFEVNEGPRVFVERIDVVGNTSTVDKVIRREVRLSEGDAFNRVLLDRSKQAVKALGFFKDVEVTDKPGSQADRSVVEVKVTEQPTGQLAFAAGYSSTESLLFDVSVEQRNLRGQGQYLRAAISTSQYEKSVDIRFTEPRFLGRNLQAGFDLFSVRTDYLSQSSFSNQRTGGSLRTQFPLGASTSLGLTYTLRQDDTQISELPVTLSDGSIVDQCNPNYIGRSVLCDQKGQFLTSVLSYNYFWDRRNDVLKPTNGFDISVRQDFAGLGGQINYVRSEVSGGIYKGLARGLVASFNLTSGYVVGWGGDNVRINDRFFKGGQTFRGFDVAGVGPRNILYYTDDATGALTNVIYGDSLGGKLYSVGTLQLDFPTGLPKEYGIGAALFAEFGTVGLLDKADKRTVVIDDGTTTVTSVIKDAASLRAAAGLSIFWDSPFGPVQFDFSQPLAKEDYDKGKSFRFSTRTRF